MERLSTNPENQGTCLTLCYQSLPVSHIGMDNQQTMTLDATSPVTLTHLNADGSVRMDSSSMGMDSQVAVAVQSLLESQQTQDNSVEEEDVFQCGRCKKQFTSLPAFLTHKQTQCMPVSVATSSGQVTQFHLSSLDEQHQLAVHQQTLHHMQPTMQVHSMGQVQGGTVKTPVQTSLSLSLASSQPIFSNAVCSVSQAGQPLTAYTTLPGSPLSHLPQGVVLTDDLMTFTTSLDPATLQVVATPYNPRSSNANSVTILGTVQPTSTYSSHQHNAAAFHTQQQQQEMQQHIQAQPCTTATLTSFSQQPLQDGSTPTNQPVTITLPEIKQPAIIRRAPTKASRKSSQAAAAGSGGARGRKGANNTGEDNRKRNLQCQYCSKVFTKNFDLQQHVRAHTGEKPFQCIVCGRAFAQKSNVKKHMATHKVWPSGTSSTLPPQPSPEENAEEGEVDEEEEEEEEEMEPQGQGVQVVGESTEEGVVITVSESQEQHEVLVKDEQEEDDDDENKDEDENGQRQVKVRVVIDNSYICQYCSEKFKTFFQLKTHMMKHKAEQVYKCVMKKCGQSFKDLEAFLEHTKTHENEMSYRCHQCNKYFPSLYDLGCHQYSHNLFPSQGMKSGPRHFQCTKCGNKYTTPEALEHHIATTTHHYPCPHCSKMFTCERFLRRHLPIHGSDGQFECGTCQKRFKTEHYLKSHLLIHSGETPYQCETCQASFNRKDKLKRHMTIHDTVKKYRCPFKSLTGCTKEFNRPDKLKCHIITHSGIKPYKCSICGKGFSRRPHMLEHERGHKSDYRYKCEKCGRGFFRMKLYTDHKCEPERVTEPQHFRPRRRRKIGRPRKRDFLLSHDSTGSDEISVVEIKRHQPPHATPGLRSSSGIHLQNARVAAAIAGQRKSFRRSSHTAKSGSEDQGGDRLDSTLDDQLEASSSTAHLAQLNTFTDKQIQQVLPGELDNSQMIDHYVVHLTECGDGSMPTLHASLSPGSLHTSLSPATLQSVQASLAAGTLQPITIIEASSTMSGVVEGGIPVVTVSRSGEVLTTQVVVGSGSPGHSQQQTFMACPTRLVDFATGEHVLQGNTDILHVGHSDS